MLMKDRQESIRREADDARMSRMNQGRPALPAKQRRLRFLSRS
jgi:hypothetical protein